MDHGAAVHVMIHSDAHSLSLSGSMTVFRRDVRPSCDHINTIRRESSERTTPCHVAWFFRGSLPVLVVYIDDDFACALLASETNEHYDDAAWKGVSVAPLLGAVVDLRVLFGRPRNLSSGVVSGDITDAQLDND